MVKPLNELQAIFSRGEVHDPVFIIGCGRSGTTALGTLLAAHPAVTYLNEPRDTWARVFPRSDIWSDRAPARGGRLVLTADDTDDLRSRRLRRIFHAMTVRRGRPLLVEKLPINTFRLGLIHEVFPGARYIHLYRNGLEVARSIEPLARAGRWFGAGGYKWDRLAEFAEGQPDTRCLPSRCDTPFLRGLLEWRLSTRCAVDFLAALPGAHFGELSYRRFTADPGAAVARLAAFLGLAAGPELIELARDTVSRRAASLDGEPLTEREREIGGPLLPLSMDGDRSGLVSGRLEDGDGDR